MSESQRSACGGRAPPGPESPFAATQAAWRFYANPRISLPQLGQPLIDHARSLVPQACEGWLLNVLDWSRLHFSGHASKADRVALGCKKDVGYDLLTSLALSDRDGGPLAPLCLELKAADGIHSTRTAAVLPAGSRLDDLTSVLEHVEGLNLGLPMVHIIDREADSVGHFRRWGHHGRLFLVRADDSRQVLHEGQPVRLADLACHLRDQGRLVLTREVLYKGKKASQWVAETTIVLHRPARRHRVIHGKARHVQVPGPPLAVRLIVSEIRTAGGALRARWLLLTNLPVSVTTATVALWYYWRWRIESYHKLLKSDGQQIEHWQQETASAVARRLAVAAMAAVTVWHLARDERPQAEQLRHVLMQLSGRQTKRGPKVRRFTEPALLAGLGTLIAMLCLTEHYDLSTLRTITAEILPWLPQTHERRRDSG